MSSLILAFVRPSDAGAWFWRLLLLIGGLACLWTAAYSSWLDRRLSSLIHKALTTWTDMSIHDYVSLLHLGSDYHIGEMSVAPNDWLAERTLAESRLRDEGVVVLGIQRANGDYLGVPHGETRVHAGDTLLIYGRSVSQEKLDLREKGRAGNQAHEQAVADQDRIMERQEEEEAERERRQQAAE